MDEPLWDDNGKLTLVETYCNTQHTCILYKHKKLQIIRIPEKEIIISRLVKSEKQPELLWLWTKKEKKKSRKDCYQSPYFSSPSPARQSADQSTKQLTEVRLGKRVS